MSFIGISVPHPTARLLESIDIPGDKVHTDQMHVTVLDLGEDIPIKQIAKAIIATYEITSHRTPFNLKTSRVKCFPDPTDKGYPIVAKVSSTELQLFRTVICVSFDKAKVQYSKRFVEYKPHVTLAYSQEPIKEIQLAECISWPAHEAIFYGGDVGDDRISAIFPFTLDLNKPPKRAKK